MSVPRPTIRSLLAIVTAIALLIAGPAALWRRSVRFEKLARMHEREAGKIGRLFTDLDLYIMMTTPSMGTGYTPEARKRFYEERAKRFSAAKPASSAVGYHQNQEQKYRRAAARPWLAVSADPPAPVMPSDEDLKRLRSEFDKLLREAGIEGTA